MVQMLRLIMIITSMKKGMCSWSLKFSRFWMGSIVSSIWILTLLQQVLAKEQCRNRCSLVSSGLSGQSTQLKEGRCMLFLLSMLRVLNLSWIRPHLYFIFLFFFLAWITFSLRACPTQAYEYSGLI
jgi:hypothetical protein